MLSKQTLKKLYFFDMIIGVVLTAASLFKFCEHSFSYLIGLIVVGFSILGYFSVEKYYDKFYGKIKVKSKKTKKKSK